MHHKGYIAFIDAHAEGIGRHHDLCPVVLEVVLGLMPLPLVHPGVVPCRSVPFEPEEVAHIVHVFPGGAVDDAAFLRPFLQQAEQFLLLLFWSPHLEIQIGAVKALGEHEGILQPQQPDDVFLNFQGSSSGKSPYRRAFRQSL
jgi:hypothetical protein